jgi:hypothetical protein
LADRHLADGYLADRTSGQHLADRTFGPFGGQVAFAIGGRLPLPCLLRAFSFAIEGLWLQSALAFAFEGPFPSSQCSTYIASNYSITLINYCNILDPIKILW